MSQPSVIVVGAGSWGVWTAIHLLRKGWSVNLIDMGTPGNDDSGSGGISRIIRLVYGEQSIYSELSLNSFPQWEMLAKELDTELYKQTGVVWLSELESNQYLIQSRSVLADLNCSLLQIDLHDPRLNKLNLDGIKEVYWEPKAGMLKASQCCERASQYFMELGGNIIRGKVKIDEGNLDNSTVEVNGRDIKADRLIFATGSWTRSVFPELLNPWTYVSRQEVFFYSLDDRSNAAYSTVPVWFNFDAKGMFYYGFPVDDEGFVKIAYDDRAVTMHPDDPRDTFTPDIEMRCRDFLLQRFPEISISSPSKFRICHYDNSLDGDYILDQHPKHPHVFLMCGSSGHGFKTGPAVGQLMAEVVNEEEQLPVEFTLSRFAGKNLKRTQFNRNDRY